MMGKVVASHIRKEGDMEGFVSALGVGDAGLVLGSGDLVTLDAVTNKMVGIDPETRAILKIGADVFGAWDRRALNVITDEMVEVFRAT